MKKTFRQLQEEIANTIGGGNIAQPNFLLRSKPVRRDTFAGNVVFEVNSDVMNRCIQGKRKYKHWKTFVGEDEVGKEIKEYATKNPKKRIILKDEVSGYMIYVK